MHEECDQAVVIKAQGKTMSELKTGQRSQGNKIDMILETLHTQTATFNDSIKELTQVLLQNARHGEVMLQLKKENDLLFISQRDLKKEVGLIKQRNAKCDGAGIFENFPKMHDWYIANKEKMVYITTVWTWYQRELGWRRFIPAAMTILTGLMAIYIGAQKLGGFDKPMSSLERDILDKHHAAENITTYGVTK
jgi:hypothetical protein